MGGPVLSPEKDSVAYAHYPAVWVRKLDGSAVISGTLEMAQQAGGFVWSPSRRAVAFTFTNEPCNLEGIGRLDLDSGRVTILLPQAAGSRRIRAWQDEDTLTVDEHRTAFSPTRTPVVTRRIDAVTGVERR
jgi:hypothetical protein